MICEICGCTDGNACFDEPGFPGQVCGWADENLCTFCASQRASPDGPPSEVCDEEEIPDLGTCCACGEESESVRNVVMLDQKAPVAGTGWGCLVCALPQDGAVAVVCDQCLALEEHGRRPIRFSCSGYPGDGGRVPVESLSGEHRHDEEKHSIEHLRMSRAVLDGQAEAELVERFGGTSGVAPSGAAEDGERKPE